jgi:hypothetical protein
MQEGLADPLIAVFDFEFRDASVRCIIEAKHTPTTIMLYTLTDMLGLRFHHWR